MTPNNKSKKPVILVMIALAVVFFAGGAVISASFKNSPIMDRLESQLGINQTQSATPTAENAESIIEIQPVPENTDGGYETTDIFKKVNPSVVSITVYSSQSISALGSGTGIIMTEDGYIVTNAHVVEGGDSINVTFSDGSSARGVVVGSDTTTDLAVVKVEANGLTAAEFGDSSALEEGERVVAIGNAGGLNSTITQGIVSGLNRDLGTGARSLKLIQVDAAINPGNSGGPLINKYGQVVGINSSKIAEVDYEGIGFSIPINEALPIIQSLVSHGYVTGRAVLGVSVVELNAYNGPINGLPSSGIYIAEIEAESDLTNQGVRTRDVIVEANGVEVATTDQLMTELDKFSPGDTFNMVIYRPETNTTFEVNVKLIESKQ